MCVIKTTHHCLPVLLDFKTLNFVHSLGNQVVYLYAMLCLRGHGGHKNVMILLSSMVLSTGTIKYRRGHKQLIVLSIGFNNYA